MNKEIKTNFSFAFVAQGISLLVSCLTNLILPKVLGTADFSYWQLFIFYATYIPCLAFGINDGIYLRYGGMKKNELDYRSVKSQYAFGIIYQSIIAIVIGLISLVIIKDIERRIIILMVLVYYIIYTCHNFLGYVFQAINETNKYSKSVILNKTFYLFVQISLMIIGFVDVFVLIPFYILAMFLALAYLLMCIKNEFESVTVDMSYGSKEAVVSIKTGISLMISNVCSMLVLGVGRQIVDTRWGLLAFGKVSFSLTLINFALTFISQISMVLFPALRRLQNEQLQGYYLKLTRGLFGILPFMYLLYFPGQYLLRLWLPAYVDSIGYLAIILPICYFDCKMNLIGNTFFKVLSKQVTLLKVNIVTIVLSGICGMVSAYFFNNLVFVIMGMVFAIVFRSVLSDIVLSRYLKVSILKYEIVDIGLAVVFILSANYLSWWISLIIISAVMLTRLMYVSKNIDFGKV